MKKRDIIITSLFCAFFAAGAIGLAALPKEVFSERENRYLADAPKLTFETLFEGEFGADTETYLQDHFPLREELVALKAGIEQARGMREYGDIYFADGFLMESFKEYDADRLSANTAAAHAILDRAKSMGASAHILLAPTAGGVLKDKLPLYAPEVNQAEIIANTGSLDVSSALTELGEGAYFKTDHHWTAEGAYAAYCIYMESIGRTATPLSAYTYEVLSEEFYGTTFSRAGIAKHEADTMTAYIAADVPVYYDGSTEPADMLAREYLTKKDKYSVYFAGNHSITVAEGMGEGKLLIVKDSFGNIFAPFAVADFAEVHMIDARFFRGDLAAYIKDNGITDTLVLYGVKSFTEDTDITSMAKLMK